MSLKDNQPQFYENDTIDLIPLFKRIYHGWKTIIVSAFISGVIGSMVALDTADIFISGSTFIPQTGGQSKTSSSLSGLASLAGINIGSIGTGSDIPPTLYPQITSSIPYMLDLLDEIFEVKGNPMTLEDYLLGDDSGFSLLGIIKKYTIGLPGMILSEIKEPLNEEIDQIQDEIYKVTEDDRTLFEALNTKLILSLNEKEGFVTLEFSDKDKFVAAQVAERANELLQERIITFKNQSARELLDFTNKQFQEKKIAYEKLQDSIAIFKDQNLNISSSLYQNRLDRLERQLNLASSVVEQLASQVEQAKLQVNKDTPVFTIIEPVTVPLYRSGPNRIFIMIIWSIFGVVISTGYVLLKDPVKGIVKMIRE